MRSVIGITLSVLLVSLASRAESPEQYADPVPSTAAVLDELLVSGEQPGPGMWKVTKDDHTLWILGTYSPLPKRMTWRSKDVEETVANSQEVLTGGSYSADIGFFKRLTLLPSLIGIRNNPDDKKLKDVLPADLYARWTVLKEKYIGNDGGIEKWRPIFAAQELYVKAIDKSGLTPRGIIWPVVEKTAKKNKIKITTPKLNVAIDKPRSVIKDFKDSALDDIECFAKTIERLETDLNDMRVRANAWAVGDMAAIRRLSYPDQNAACFAAVMNAQVVQERGFQDLPNRMTAVWVAAAETALVKNQTTFAVLSIAEIFKTGGYVDTLRAKGYVIEEP